MEESISIYDAHDWVGGLKPEAGREGPREEGGRTKGRHLLARARAFTEAKECQVSDASLLPFLHITGGRDETSHSNVRIALAG